MDVINTRPPRTRVHRDPSVCHHPARPSSACDFCPALRGEGEALPARRSGAGTGAGDAGKDEDAQHQGHIYDAFFLWRKQKIPLESDNTAFKGKKEAKLSSCCPKSSGSLQSSCGKLRTLPDRDRYTCPLAQDTRAYRFQRRGTIARTGP